MGLGLVEEGLPPRYSLLRLVKAGAFGAVYLAKDSLGADADPTPGTASGQPKLLALKLIKRSRVARDGFSQGEVLLHMRLRHPHIVELKEVFLTDDHLVLVMELAPGGDLSAAVPSGQGLPEADVRWLFQQVAFALEYCHRMGVASRDIKLENVLLMDQGARPIAKLADWGLSTQCVCRGLARYEGAVGTPTYFSPELLSTSRGQLYDAKASDVWAMGVMLYILLTGCCPFQRTSDVGLDSKERMQLLLQRIQHVAYIMPDHLSPACQDLLRRILVADPSQRPSVAEVLSHPWCAAEGLPADIMLQYNNTFLARSLTHPPSPKLLQEVHAILREAAMAPGTPMLGPSPNVSRVSASDEERRSWAAAPAASAPAQSGHTGASAPPQASPPPC